MKLELKHICGYLPYGLKAITVKQPWAYLICAGIKNIENRTWNTKYRGRVYIHAAAKWDKRHRDMSQLFTPEQWNSLREEIQLKMVGGILPCSSIIGHVDIVGCETNYDSIWAEKSDMYVESHVGVISKPPIYNWVLENPVLFDKPILNVKGKLSFWDCSEYLAQPEHISASNPISKETGEIIQQICRKAYKTK